MRTNMDNPAIGRVLIAIMISLAGLTGCGTSEAPPAAKPTSFVTAPGEGTLPGPGEAVAVTAPVAVVPVDSSASVVGTDLLAAAENRVRELVNTMPVGGKVVVYSINRNVGAMCDPLVLTLPKQANPDLEKQAREATVQAVAGKFQGYIECSTSQDPGGTELFGGLAEILSYYPNAEIVEVYTDGCDTVTTPGLCKAKNLRNPEYPAQVLASIPAVLTPQLGPNVQFTFRGIGRNTGLSAEAIAVLRQVITTWVQQTGAKTYFTVS